MNHLINITSQPYLPCYHNSLTHSKTQTTFELNHSKPLTVSRKLEEMSETKINVRIIRQLNKNNHLNLHKKNSSEL
jgi:hypothetical protein